MEATIRPAAGYGSGGLVGYMPEGTKISDINRILGFRAQHGKSSDGKMTKSWVFTIDGVEGHIYDYKGSKWHVGGSVAAFKLLALHLGCTIDERRMVRPDGQSVFFR